MQIAVLYGGIGPEREVSLASGAAVLRAVREAGWEPLPVEITAEGDFLIDALTLEPAAAVERLQRRGVDAVFVALHGPFGEDGVIQGFLRVLRLPFTGPDVECAAIAMHKHATRLLFADAGIPIAPGRFLRTGDAFDIVGMTPPVVVKPCRLGSSVGVRILMQSEEVAPAVKAIWAMRQDCVVEQYIAGREFSCPVRDTSRGPEALPVIEIRPCNGREFFDFEAKYGAGEAEEIVRTDAAPRLAQLQVLALRCHKLLGCRGFSRTDFILSEGGPVVLETNTIPGLTENSLLPKSARAAGITMATLVRECVELAVAQYHTARPAERARACAATA